MSNPYAPPEDRPREAAPGGTAQGDERPPGTAQGTPAPTRAPAAGARAGEGAPGDLPPTPAAGPPAPPHAGPVGPPTPPYVGPVGPPAPPYVGPVGPADHSPAGVPYERARSTTPPAPAANPADVGRVARLSRTTSLLVLLTVLADLLPFPWYVGGAPAAIAALVVGVRALTVATRTRQRAPRAVLSLLLVVAVLCLARPGTALLTWQAESQYAHCQAGALTVQAQSSCLSDYQRALEDRAGQLTHRTP